MEGCILYNNSKNKEIILNDLISVVKSNDILKLYFNQRAFEDLGMSRAEDFLIDALERLKNFIQKDNSIKQIETTSQEKHIELLINLGFNENELTSILSNDKNNEEFHILNYWNGTRWVPLNNIWG